MDLSQRTKHGALLDSTLLASVYVELLGERQAMLHLNGQGAASQHDARARAGKAKQRPAALPPRLDAAAEAAHRRFVESLGAGALWLRYALRI
jgi:DNA polymerase-3 subunit epsilon